MLSKMIVRSYWTVIVLILASAVQAKTIKVPDEFESIQAAIDAASEGDEILLGAGTYKEEIVLKNESIVRGESRDSVTLEGVEGTTGTLILAENLENFTLADLTVRGPGGKADSEVPPMVSLIGGKGTINNCRLVEAAGYGLSIQQGADVLLIDMIVEECGFNGVTLSEDANARVENCIVRKNGHNGLSVLDATCTAQIVDSSFIENDWAGLYIDQGAAVEFKNNVDRDNGRSTPVELRLIAAEMDYESLEEINRHFRDKAFYDVFGNVNLGDYYSSLASSVNMNYPSSVDTMMQFIEDWKKEYPESVIPYVLEGEVHIDLAWYYRGSGWASSVSNDGWKKFEEHLNLANAVLENAEKLDDRDPHLYRVWTTTGMGLGFDNRTMDRITSKGAEIKPNYYPMYYSRATSLLPRWGGNHLDNERLARYIMEQNPDDGTMPYARMAHYLTYFICAEELLIDFGFKYEDIASGYSDLIEEFPECYDYKNGYARFAYAAEDRETVEFFMGEIVDNPLQRYWNDNSFQNAQRWLDGDEGASASNQYEIVSYGMGQNVVLIFIAVVCILFVFVLAALGVVIVILLRRSKSKF